MSDESFCHSDVDAYVGIRKDGAVWVDDSQISTLIVIKRWGDNVGITVNIEEEVNF